MKDEIVEQVIDKYHIRSMQGIKEYGTTLENNNSANYLLELQTELMDATLYIQKLMDQNRELTALVRDTPNDMELGQKIRKLIS